LNAFGWRLIKCHCKQGGSGSRASSHGTLSTT
jgi:hypothetical protein